jgi:hypothetical protein
MTDSPQIPEPPSPTRFQRIKAALLRDKPALVTLIYAAVWCWFDSTALYLLPEWVEAVGFAPALPLIVYWLRLARGRDVLYRNAVRSIVTVPIWQGLLFLMRWLRLGDSATVDMLGRGIVFTVGLLWAVWAVEKAARKFETLQRSDDPLDTTSHNPRWNPLDVRAWYYGQRQPKLNQSLATLLTYTLAFFLLGIALTSVRGCSESYEMPAGGGGGGQKSEAQKAQNVTIQKVIRKKIVINPFSSIIFNPPPIDNVKLQLQEITKHSYVVGEGEGIGVGKGKGAGFGAGTGRGAVRLIRLEYPGGDWDVDLSINSDVNMLIEYGVRTAQKVGERAETRTIDQLRNFPLGKSPPVVFMSGQKGIALSAGEVKILREYLTDKHGMLFASAGSNGWHNSFFAMMRQLLPNVEPVRVPLDDDIHKIPFPIPYLPYVSPHGGKDAWGWKIDGRWVVYYHPGDIADAWSDGHSGVKRDIWDACYQLGVNVIFYAHAEYNKWLESRNNSGSVKPVAD